MVESLGKIIKRRRKKLGWTQKDLAKKLDVTSVSVGKWEQNVSKPKEERLQMISEFLDIDIDDLKKLAMKEKEYLYLGDVFGTTYGDVHADTGHIYGALRGDLYGNVKGDIWGRTKNIYGNIEGGVWGYIDGTVTGHIGGDLVGTITGAVEGDVHGTVSGKICGIGVDVKRKNESK